MLREVEKVPKTAGTASSVARRWARALISLAAEQGRSEAWAQELERVRDALRASPELQDLWRNPAHGRDRRMASVDALAGPLQLSPTVANALRLMVERGRLEHLEAVVRAFREMADEQAGRVRGSVASAAPLEDGALERIARALSSASGRDVVLTPRTDPSLVGGVVAELGGTVVDGSLRTQLGLLEQHLRRVRA